MIYTIKYKLNVTKQFVQRATSINTIRGRKNGYRMASESPDKHMVEIPIWLECPYGTRKKIYSNQQQGIVALHKCTPYLT